MVESQYAWETRSASSRDITIFDFLTDVKNFVLKTLSRWENIARKLWDRLQIFCLTL